MEILAILNRVEVLLKARGRTKTQLYAACGVTASAVSQWKSGRTTPSPKNLQRIADYLGVSYEYLTTGLGEKSPSQEDQRKDELWRIDEAYSEIARQLQEKGFYLEDLKLVFRFLDWARSHVGESLDDLNKDDVSEGPTPQFIRRTELLKRRGISLSELSQKTGISVHRLKRYFSEDTLGQTDLGYEYPKLARALGVSPQYLSCLTDQENDESDTDEKFRNYLMGHSNIQDSFPEFQHLYEQKEPIPVAEDGLDPELVALIKRIPSDRMPEVERYLRFQAEQEENP